MMNPMAGVSPQQLQQALELGNHLTMEIRKHRKEGCLEVRFIKINPAEQVDLAGAVDSLAVQLSLGFGKYFGLKGEMIDVV